MSTILLDIRGLSVICAEGRRLERQEAEGPETTWALLPGRIHSSMRKWASLSFSAGNMKVGAQKWENTTKNARGSSVQGASEAKQ